MITIRLRKQHWGKAWRAMIEVGPVRLIAKDPVYEVLPAHLDVLKALGIPYEFVRAPKDRGHGIDYRTDPGCGLHRSQ